MIGEPIPFPTPSPSPRETLGVTIRLNRIELLVGGWIGCARQIEALRRGYKDKHGFNEDGWECHAEGAMAEMAAARAIDRYWTMTVNTFRGEGDVGRYEVRRRSENWHDALVRPDEADERIHIAVFGKAPEFWVAGWCHGYEAKQDQWLKTHGGRPPAYFMPKEELHPLKWIPLN